MFTVRGNPLRVGVAIELVVILGDLFVILDLPFVRLGWLVFKSRERKIAEAKARANKKDRRK